MEASSLSENEKISWLRLIRSQNIGPITFYKLLARYGTASNALETLPEISKKQKKELYICSIEEAEKELAALSSFGAGVLYAGAEDYPLALAAIEDAPPILTYRGDKNFLHQSGVGIVGARNASHNGRKFAQHLARDLGQGGQMIFSGLARGIDTSAHEGSLENGTVAVIAGGIDIIYPEENTKLYHAICEQGCVVAESPFGQKPFAQSFPRRNRIISGLSNGVIVVEASLRSGSLITARLAAEQGRDVFAVPGFPFDPRAAGPNKLLKDGAILVEKAQDVVEHLHLFKSSEISYPHTGLNEESENSFLFEGDEHITENASEQILNTLSMLPVHMDEVFRDLNISPATGNSAILELEITGKIKRVPGGKICRIA